MAFTYFFRDLHTLELIEQHVVPRLRCRRYVDIWDAGCATGAESYSLAIMLRENMGEFQFRNVSIFATDLNVHFREVVKRGVYPADQVKRIPEHLQRKYFELAEEPGYFVVAEPLRKVVSFEEHDLTSLRPIRDGFSLIVCKNVLLHLSRQERLDVLRMFRDSLCKGGYLATEQTQKMPPEAEGWFEQVVDGGRLFQRVE